MPLSWDAEIIGRNIEEGTFLKEGTMEDDQKSVRSISIIYLMKWNESSERGHGPQNIITDDIT